MTTQQGSTANVMAAICSVLLPGLGQLVQGRLLMALFFFVVVGSAWGAASVLVVPVILAVPLHVWCIWDAARFRTTA